MIESNRGGWSLEEGAGLLAYFGEDTVVDILERSPIEPRVVIAWIEWDRLPPSIYLVDFRERTRYDTPICEEFMSVAASKASRWSDLWPAAAAPTD